ncbi:MAG TPA: outer membrane protein assembly factor BamD [Bacteroidales bacterium]|jgi:outer membrane protein assembly factor BamD|nr:outer membrane protein assembly factor BamD [Bacteroidales bacterium]
MLKKCIYIIIIVLSSVVTIISCSGYEKILKSDDVDLKFTKAFYYYNRGDYVKAATIFDQLAPIIRGTRRADSVYFYQAMTQYKLNDYIIAGHYFNNFVQIYGNSVLVEEAAYMESYCYYMQSPRPELDQTSTRQALDAFRLYMIRYPNSPRIPDCQKIIVELNEKMMEKAYLSAQLYFNLNNYKAAVVSLSNCLSDFPESKYREVIMFRLLKAKYLLAMNSIQSKQTERFQDAIDEYYTYIAEFPESKNKEEADEIYQDASRFVKEPEENELSNN